MGQSQRQRIVGDSLPSQFASSRVNKRPCQEREGRKRRREGGKERKEGRKGVPTSHGSCSRLYDKQSQSLTSFSNQQIKTMQHSPKAICLSLSGETGGRVGRAEEAKAGELCGSCEAQAIVFTRRPCCQM